jgi:hypothetical protein
VNLWTFPKRIRLMTTLELKTTILPGGRIEVEAPGLREGQEVTLHIVVQDETPPAKKSLLENLGGYKGGRLFKTAAEVDAYIKEERDSWGD